MGDWCFRLNTSGAGSSKKAALSAIFAVLCVLFVLQVWGNVEKYLARRWKKNNLLMISFWETHIVFLKKIL